MVNVETIEKNEQEYEEQLNEIYGTVSICGIEYNAGHALKLIDETAFRCGLADEPIRYCCGSCNCCYDEEEEAEECCKED